MASELTKSLIFRNLSLFDLSSQLAKKFHSQGQSLFDLAHTLFFEKKCIHSTFVEIISAIRLTSYCLRWH